MSVRTWTLKEDKLLNDLVQFYGPKKWKNMAKKINLSNPFKKRNGRICKDRWIHLSKSSGVSNWDLVQEFLFFEVHSKIGNKWTDITKFIFSRTDNDLKNHFYSNLRKVLRKLSGRKKNFERKLYFEKMISYYILKNINMNLSLQLSENETKISTYHTYVLRYLKKEKIQIDQIPAYLDDLYYTILDDKVVKETLVKTNEKPNSESIHQIITSIVYFELFKRCFDYAQDNKQTNEQEKNKKFQVLKFLSENTDKIKLVKLCHILDCINVKLNLALNNNENNILSKINNNNFEEMLFYLGRELKNVYRNFLFLNDQI